MDERDDDILKSRVVRRMCGGISDMTLWRWINQGIFPAPDLVINRRRCWYRSTIKTAVAKLAASAEAAA